ncbi:DUF1905 domain-containing protein [Acinetobacter sp.]|jgi:hypothetical protein|uniref:DUF1905 domain-containing protein n=1 Tax=Acinetobacter sp. TaxID=472 RepID=UPI002829F9F0|nr:DUF1905 domain-containing protein [Acinetobacter sp.]MDR0237358.1 DUF1905 domain-containing protein [Acinetobacter sp.]
MIDNKIQLSVESTVQRYSGAGGWHYVIVSKQQAMEIKNYLLQRQSWGLVSVTVTVGQSVWKTSIFPDKQSEGYLLPLKAEIRNKEKIYLGDSILLSIDLSV